MTPLDFVEALRKVLVETLVPEIRNLREDTNRRFEAMQKQLDERFNAMQKQIDDRFAAVQREIAELRGEFKGFKETQRVQSELLNKILDKLDVSERISKLEERVEILSQKVLAA